MGNGEGREMMEHEARPARRTFWLISRDGVGGRPETLLIETGEEEALALFGFEEEGEMYLWFRGLGDGWRVKEYADPDLLSLLRGPLADVEKVALDPLPEDVRGADGRVYLTRRLFMDRLSNRGNPLGGDETA